MDKIFSTIDSQIKKLCSRGMVITDNSEAKRILELENYYNLIN